MTLSGKKGAIELSVNTLVVVIISVVILGGGLALLYSLVSQSWHVKDQLDDQTTAEIERLLTDEGKPVALPFHFAEIVRGDNAVFGVGILNKGGVSGSFYLNVELSSAVNEAGEDISAQVDVIDWLTYYTKEILLEKEGDQVKEPISVSVPNEAKKGEYIFRVRVCHDPDCQDQYGKTQKIYVTVT
jgi:hypothetical protein